MFFLLCRLSSEESAAPRDAKYAMPTAVNGALSTGP